MTDLELEQFKKEMMDAVNKNNKLTQQVIMALADVHVDINNNLKIINAGLYETGQKINKLSEVCNQLLANQGLTDEEIYNLHEVQNCTWSEISQRTGLSKSTVQRRAKRFKIQVLSDMEV